MKDEEASHSQEELARLRHENARLRAMIDHLERRSADEPASPAADTQIIKTEAEPLPAKLRNRERPKKPRKKKRRKPATLSILLMVFIALFALAVIILISMELLFRLGISAPWFSNLAGFAFFLLFVAILGFFESITLKAREDWRRHQRQKLAQSKRKKPKIQPQRRRITRKLRAATTQKLSEDDC